MTNNDPFFHKKKLIYILLALEVIDDLATLYCCMTPGMGGPTTMLSFLLKISHFNEKNVV